MRKFRAWCPELDQTEDNADEWDAESVHDVAEGWVEESDNLEVKWGGSSVIHVKDEHGVVRQYRVGTRIVSFAMLVDDMPPPPTQGKE